MRNFGNSACVAGRPALDVSTVSEPLGRHVVGGTPAPPAELPKFRIDPGDLLPQLLRLRLVVLDHLPIGRNQVRPVGQQLLVILRRRLGREDRLFSHMPALAALGLPKRLRLPRAGQADRLHGGPAGDRDVSEFAGLGVADFHRERADADAVLLRRRPDHVSGERGPASVQRVSRSSGRHLPRRRPATQQEHRISCSRRPGRSGNVLGSNRTTPNTTTGMPHGVRPLIDRCTHRPSTSRHSRAETSSSVCVHTSTPATPPADRQRRVEP